MGIASWEFQDDCHDVRQARHIVYLNNNNIHGVYTKGVEKTCEFGFHIYYLIVLRHHYRLHLVLAPVLCWHIYLLDKVRIHLYNQAHAFYMYVLVYYNQRAV